MEVENRGARARCQTLNKNTLLSKFQDLLAAPWSSSSSSSAVAVAETDGHRVQLF